MRLAPACRKRLSDLQPDQSIAESLHSFWNKVIASAYKLLGSPQPTAHSPQGEGINKKKAPDWELFAVYLD
jgi:hypothetical protein